MCWTEEELREKHGEVTKAMEDHLGRKKQHEMDHYSASQPIISPEIDNGLIGKQIEVLTDVVVEVEEEEGAARTYEQWLPSVITALSDGACSTQLHKGGDGEE